MTTWDYKLFTVTVNGNGLAAMTSANNFQSTFQSLGNDGWELAGVTPDCDGYGLQAVLYIFKRPMQ